MVIQMQQQIQIHQLQQNANSLKYMYSALLHHILSKTAEPNWDCGSLEEN